MAWNEPGGNNNDPWKNRGGKEQGPPDLVAQNGKTLWRRCTASLLLRQQPSTLKGR